MTVSFGHVGITVPDLDRAIGWYRDALGCALIMGPVDVTVDDPRVAEQIREVFAATDVAFRQAHMILADGSAVELFEFRRPCESEGRARFDYWEPGISHLCVVSPDIEALAERVEQQGGRRRTAIREIFPDEPYRFCYCEDPFGNIVELATHPHGEAFGGRAAY